MNERVNGFGQPVGVAVEGWTARPLPPHTPMVGRWCTVEVLDVARHGSELFDANLDDADGRNWTWLGSEPIFELPAYCEWLTRMSSGNDPLFHAIVDNATGKAIGVAAYLRIEPAHGVIEIGHINYSPRLQRTPAATEAMFLMMSRVFDELGYRRYEWKCDNFNAPSRAAAARLGFSFEGVFRQHMVYKNRNRDSAWFSILDSEWPVVRAAFEAWCDAGNFDEGGKQKRGLAEIRAAIAARS